MKTDTDNIKAALTLLLAAILEVVICGFFVTLFWNLTIPTIFTELNSLNYFQGLGLYMLCRFLFYTSKK